jgi:hypothetical protein
LLTVSVTTLRHTENLYAYTVDLAVYQTAVLLRDPTPRSLVTWSVGSIALVESSDLRAIFTSVSQQIEKFIQAYRSVNPRACPEGGQHAAARARLRQVQERLQAAGFAPGPLDGRLGPQTRPALSTAPRVARHGQPRPADIESAAPPVNPMADLSSRHDSPRAWSSAESLWLAQELWRIW